MDEALLDLMVQAGTYGMFGFLDETEEEMRSTVDYAVSLPNHVTLFFFLLLFPGTEISQMNPEVVEKVREFEYGYYYKIAFDLSAVPDDVMAKILKTAYRRFYLSPSRMFRVFRDMPKNSRLLLGLAIVRLGFAQSTAD